MSEFSIEDDPDPLPRLKNGLHYYDVQVFMRDIIRPDSPHTEQYREWYPNEVAKDDHEVVLVHPSSYIEGRVNPTRSTMLLRRLGRLVGAVSVE